MHRLRALFLAAVAACGMVHAARAAQADDPLAALNAEFGSPITIEAVIEPGTGGGPDMLAITARLEEGWHLYAITQKPGGPKATRITLADDAARTLAGPFVPDSPPRAHEAADVPSWKGLVLEEHAGSVTWRAPLAAGGRDAEIRGAVSVQLCRDNACTPPETHEFTARVGKAAGRPAAPAPASLHRPERAHAAVSAAIRPGAGATGWALEVTLEPEEGWHLYRPSGTATSGVGEGKPTIVASGSGNRARVVAVTPRPTQAPTAPDLVAAGAVEGPVVLDVAITGAEPLELWLGFQTCTDSSCDPPAGVRLLARPPADSGPTGGSIEFEDARYAEAAQSPLPLAFPPGDVVPAAGVAPAIAGTQSLTLPLVLLMGLAGGLILNLMPCVLPVLGLKLMSFAQQSGRERREVFEMNLWYCAGLYAVFFILATASVAANIGLGQTNLAWGEQFTSARFNIAMVGIVFAFALSFLGIWELPIPGFIGEQAGHVQSREGPMGAFLKGVLSTVLATPCSGPFLGPVFGFTLSQPTAVTYAVFGAIATGMALPYFLVGFFPGLVRVLPRPGAWMATFKEVLGFVMLGTVVYLFTFLKHDWFIPTLAMLFGIWAACWWVGRAQERLGGAVGFGRWVQSAVVATAIGTAAFLLLGPHESIIRWEEPFSRARLAELRGGGATVMVDFSADWCPTCKYNLATAIETRRVKAVVDRNRVVPVLADWTDGSLEIKQMLESLESRSIPVLAIFPAAAPGGQVPPPIVLRDVITESQVIEALERAGPSRGPAPEIRAASTAPVGGGR